MNLLRTHFGTLAVAATLAVTPVSVSAADDHLPVDNPEQFFAAFKAVCLDHFGNSVAQESTATSPNWKFRLQNTKPGIGKIFWFSPLRLLILGESEARAECKMATNFDRDVSVQSSVNLLRTVLKLGATKLRPDGEERVFWLMTNGDRTVVAVYQIQPKGNSTMTAILRVYSDTVSKSI